MRILPLIIFLLPAALWAAKDPELTPADLSTFAVFLAESVTAPNAEGVDNFVLRNVDGKEVREVGQFRFGKDAAGTRLIYSLILPGRHTITLRYHRLKKKFLGDTLLDAEVTHEADLAPGLYKVKGEREAEYAVIWAVRVDTGELIVPKTKCLPRKGQSSPPIVIPIPVR